MRNNSIYLRQLIDCNCNDCAFMTRDFSDLKLEDYSIAEYLADCGARSIDDVTISDRIAEINFQVN